MDKIILIGAGGHARSCMDVIESSVQFKIVGLVEKQLNICKIFNEEREDIHNG